MIRSINFKSYPTGIFLLAFVSVLPSSCRLRKESTSSMRNSSEENPLAAYEVVDCTPKLCGGDVSIVNINPTDQDLTALGANGNDARFALDESTAVDDVRGPEAEVAIDKATAANSVLRSALVDPKKPSNTRITSTGLSGLFGGLSTVLSGVGQVSTFMKDNIEADSEAERQKTMTRLTSLLTEVSQLVKPEEKEKLVKAMPVLRLLAGDDGWLNRGDLPRFLPVIPNIVGEIADEKISQGYAEGLADLARTKAFFYRRWVRAPNGIIGRVVQKNVDKGLNSAYSQKWTAIRDASDKFQQTFNGLMGQYGTNSYYMNVTDGKNYYDPGKAVDEDQIDELIRVMTGRSLQDVVRTVADNPQNAQMPDFNAGAASVLLEAVTLPDGIPVEDIDELLKETNGFTKISTPKNLAFKLLPNGKLQVRKKKTAAITNDTSTSSTPQKPTKDTPAPETSATNVSCLANTSVDRNGALMMYLYSSAPGQRIELTTGNGLFTMPWEMIPQNDWPLIRGGYAHYSWRNLGQAPMRITLNDGTLVDCTATLEHR